MRQKSHSYPFTRFHSGLTLIKLMAIIAIFGILASWGISKIPTSLQQNHAPEVSAAHKDIADIVSGLDRYKTAHGAYPSAEQGLLALVLKPAREPSPEDWKTGGYIKRLPRDPWGNSYQYRVVDDNQVEVFSFGEKGPDHSNANEWILRTSK